MISGKGDGDGLSLRANEGNTGEGKMSEMGGEKITWRMIQL